MTDSDSDSSVSTISDGVGEGYIYGVFDPHFFDISNSKAARLSRRYNIPLLPPSHFLAQGYGIVYSHVIAPKVQRKLIGFIGQMMCGAEKLTLRTEQYVIFELGHTIDVVGDSIPYYEVNEEEFVMFEHDDALLPLWRAFADSLSVFARQSQERGNMKIRLSISNMEVTGEVATMIAHALKGVTCLEGLYLRNYGNQEAASIAAGIVEESPAIKCLIFEMVVIDDIDVARRLVSVAKNHSHLDNIQLRGCGLGQNMDVLNVIVDSIRHYSSVTLSENDLGREGIDYLTGVLETNPPRLRTLILKGSGVCDEDAEGLCVALKCNTNLSYLSLHPHNLTERGMGIAEKALFDPTSLNAMYDCNHTSTLGMMNRSSSSIPTWVNSSYSLDTQNLDKASMFKIHLQSKLLFMLGALGTENLNCHYLKDMSLELIPELLCFLQSGISREAQNRSEMIIPKVVPLQNVFDAVKNCVVPLRFVPSMKLLNKELAQMYEAELMRIDECYDNVD